MSHMKEMRLLEVPEFHERAMIHSSRYFQRPLQYEVSQTNIQVSQEDLNLLRQVSLELFQDVAFLLHQDGLDDVIGILANDRANLLTAEQIILSFT